MVTIKDIAKATGVAPSTVSRVIADSSRISEKTKEKVRKAMQELGYHPNVHARNLVAKKTSAIAVIMPSSADSALQNPFFPEVLRGIGSVIHENQYTMILSSGQSKEEISSEVERLVYGSYVDGFILLYSRINDPVVNFLTEHGCPFVIVGKPTEQLNEITHVDNDNYEAGKQVTQHLIDKGHERIAFVGGSREFLVTVDRESGYEAALDKAGLKNCDEYKIHTEFLKSGGREAVDCILKMEKESRPTALVVSDDLISLGIVSELEERGLAVPVDISIVSFNNFYLSEVLNPALTTVDIHIQELGAQSAKALIEIAAGKTTGAKRIIIPHNVVYRDSVRER